MTAVVPDSQQIRAELARRGIPVRRHPWIGRRRMLFVQGEAEAVAAVVATFGECRWERGRWRVRRPQLRLPGF